MKCPKCESDNREGIRFCEECGAKLELECPVCKAKIPLGKKFCGECGHDLTKPVEVQVINYSEPQSYTPKFLANKILTTRSSIEGERKLVTVLFADVADFTSIAEKRDPEEVHHLMDNCFKILMDKIHTYEGTINQFTGYSKKVQRDFGIHFKLRIGLNSGPVIVGSIGDDLRMDYTAVGDTTNLAARMESMARPGTVLISEPTYRLVRDFFELKSMGKVEVKGKDKPQQAFELMKAGEVETRIEAAVTKGLTRFIGRKNSMAALMQAYEKTKSGAGQVFGIVGEAGVGKSRLLLEFKNRISQEETTYLQGRCIHYGGSMAYLPILDILRSYFNLNETDRELIIKKKMKDKIHQLDDKLEGVLPPFEDLLSLDVLDEAYIDLEPKQKRARTFVAVRDLLIRESQNRLLVLAVEDLHWIDKTSEEFLDYLIGWLASARILLILLYRPEYTHSWGSKSYYNRIGLGQLTTKSSAELVQAILEGAEVAGELKKLILSRTGGNPLFMEEFTHGLMENGSIQRQDNQYVLRRKASEIQVPDTIQGIIAARMDRLEDNLKRTMQIASVIGRDFAFRILQLITGMREELNSYLLNLQGLELIYEKSLFPELEYIFKHALIQEVAYNSLLLSRRKEIHKKIGRAIEQIYPERLEEFYEMLAYHCYEGENWLKALDYLAKAGDKSAAAYANQEALDYYAKALEVCAKIGNSALEKSFRLAKKRGMVNSLIGNFQGAIDDFNTMRAAAVSMKDRHFEGIALAYRGWAEHQNHRVEKAENTLKTALNLAEEGYEDVRCFASVTLGAIYLIYNRHSEARPFLMQAEKLAPQVDDPFILGWWSMFGSLWPNWEGRFDDALRHHDKRRRAIKSGGVAFLMNSWVEALPRGGKGEYEKALALLEDVLAIGKRMGDDFWLARGLNTMGWLHAELQDHRQAMAWNKQGLEAALKANFPIPEVENNARLNLADNLLALGRLEEAEEQYKKVEQVARNPRPLDKFMLWRYSQHLFHSYGELWLVRGHLDKALAYAGECLALAQRSNSQKNIVKGKRLRGQVYLAQGKLAEAQQEISIALKIAHRVGNPTQLWKTYAVIGNLRQAQVRSDEARRTYSDAYSTIENVAASLQNQSRKDTFMSSPLVREIRQKISTI
jgi:class 3 adenylate cyclase/tetratricopeptide (TPR) repeat protein